MREVTLLLVETSGIQDYVFGSNNLAQNIGASELVARATSEWVADALDKLKIRHNVRWHEDQGKLVVGEESITAAGVGAEVVYAGGGNTMILFAGGKGEHAQAFTRILTTSALREARGLALVIGSVDFDWDKAALSSELRRLRSELSRRKLNRPPDVPLLGLGVTAACDFTGLPVIGMDIDGHQISQVVAHKLAATEQGKKRLHVTLPQVDATGYEFVYDFEMFGEKGESSYIAVVHTDGNSMGKRFEKLAGDYPLPQHNALYVKALRRLSSAVNRRAEIALRATVDGLLTNLDEPTDLFGKVVPVPKGKRKERFLPFRPIVFGGDDVTFVCEGRLGLALAARYLQSYADEAEGLTARGGVAVVKAHYPFSRAYDLAEALCKSAKGKIKDFTLPGKEGTTIIDWHFATSGVVLGLDELRQREYTSDTGRSLLMRPVWLDPTPGQKRASKYWRSWHNFAEVTRKLQEGEWADRRNKVKALRDALRSGPDAVTQFLRNYRVKDGLPLIPEQPDMAKCGWQGDDCGYFDAVEATDFFVPLTREEGTR
jgi:hypothetical protein